MKKFALLIGLQASGKTFFAENYLVKNGYKFVNGDRFLKKSEQEIPLEKIEKIVVNSLNSDYQGIVFEFSFSNNEIREKFLNIAQKYDLQTEYFLMKTSLKDSLYRNSQRVGNKILEKTIIQRNKNLFSMPPSFLEGVDNIYDVFISNKKIKIIPQNPAK